MSDSEERQGQTPTAARAQRTNEAARPSARRGLSRRGWTVLLSALLAGVFGAVGVTVDVPYVVLGPGPIYDTLSEVEGAPVVEIEGESSYETSGSLSLTTVSVADEVTMFEGLARWVSGRYALAPREQYFPPGTTEEEVREQNIEQFESSQSAAETAALRYLGYPVDVFVGQVVPDQAADGVLSVGDELLAVDGDNVASAQEVQDAVEGARPGDEVEVTATGEGDSEQDAETQSVQLGEHPDTGQAFLGIGLEEQADVDFTVDVTLDEVGGPSAGVIFAVAIVDRMTPGELLADGHVAGSGEMARDGTVGPIGGIGFKVEAADEAGADAFLVPEQNCGEARAAASDEMTLIAVTTLQDTVTALEARADGGTVPTC